MNSPVNTAPGSTAYFPSCVSRIRETHPDFPLEPVILQSILLCLVAGNTDGSPDGYTGRKNLILRTRDEDVGVVLNLACLVSVFVQCTNSYTASGAAVLVIYEELLFQWITTCCHIGEFVNMHAVFPLSWQHLDLMQVAQSGDAAYSPQHMSIS